MKRRVYIALHTCGVQRRADPNLSKYGKWTAQALAYYYWTHNMKTTNKCFWH